MVCSHHKSYKLKQMLNWLYTIYIVVKSFKKENMLEEAKQDLKNKIIAENSEEHYYKLIADRVKPLYEFKQAGDFVFGADDDQFREQVIKTTLQKNIELDESLQLYELVMTEIALDVFMDNG